MIQESQKTLGVDRANELTEFQRMAAKKKPRVDVKKSSGDLPSETDLNMEVPGVDATRGSASHSSRTGGTGSKAANRHERSATA